jgi:hypothetical protein
MNTHKRLLQDALNAAMDVRNRTKRDILHPICVFDVSAELGVEVRFLSLPRDNGRMFKSGISPTLATLARTSSRTACQSSSRLITTLP